MTTQTVRDARDAYFAASGFDDSTYTDDWVDIEIGPLALRFPNTEARKAVVPIHDLHHAMTGYQADLAGEAEIAGFEVAGGMGRHLIGWYLNLLTMSHGILIRPRRTFRAFVRGRRARNFYRDLAYDESVLDEPALEIRQRMAITDRPRSRAGDVFAFAGWGLTAAVVGLVSIFTTLPAMAVMGLWRGVK